MRSFRGKLFGILGRHVGKEKVAKKEAYPVKNFRELVEQVAQIAYWNKDVQLFFRGQEQDYYNKENSSSFYPSIYRGERVTQEQIDLKFDTLSIASKMLCNFLIKEKLTGASDVRKRKYIQWSILQHYEVCPTPLLDFTQSLRVACSFALMNGDRHNGYVFIFGLPYLTNRISINSEHDLATIRLLSICPPEALRPYFQEGYLSATEEITTNYDSKDELDFNRRLIAKIEISNARDFWEDGLSILPRDSLYPIDDRFTDICNEIKKEIVLGVNPGKIGNFLQAWAVLEKTLTAPLSNKNNYAHSLLEAINYYKRNDIFSEDLLNRVNYLRKIRNNLVHSPDNIRNEEMAGFVKEIKGTTSEVGKIMKIFNSNKNISG